MSNVITSLAPTSCAAVSPTGVIGHGRCGIGNSACGGTGPAFISANRPLGARIAPGSFSVPVYLGEILPEDVAVQLYADSYDAGGPYVGDLARGEAIIGAANGHIYAGSASSVRPAEDYTVRIVPRHRGVQVPTELPLIVWQK